MTTRHVGIHHRPSLEGEAYCSRNRQNASYNESGQYASTAVIYHVDPYYHEHSNENLAYQEGDLVLPFERGAYPGRKIGKRLINYEGIGYCSEVPIEYEGYLAKRPRPPPDIRSLVARRQDMIIIKHGCSHKSEVVM